MSTSATVEQEIVSIMQSTFVETCCQVAVSVVLMYDWLLTFGQEVELFWRKPSGAAVLFALNRLTTLGLVVLGNVDPTSYTSASCTYISVWFLVFVEAAYIMWAVVSALRVYAVTQKNSPLSLLTFFLAIFPFASHMYFNSKVSFLAVPLGPVSLCAENSLVGQALSGRMLVATRACNMGSDLIVLLVTLYYLCPRPFSNMYIPPRSLIQMLLRDGMLYFIILTTVNFLEIILYVASASDYVNLFLAPISTVIISRFMLNVRACATVSDADNGTSGAYGESDTRTRTSQPHSLAFVTQTSGSDIYFSSVLAEIMPVGSSHGIASEEEGECERASSETADMDGREDLQGGTGILEIEMVQRLDNEGVCADNFGERVGHRRDYVEELQ